MKISETIDAGKQKFDADATWSMLKNAGRVSIAKGKKYETFSPAKDGKEIILKKAMGPSGNLRAPTLRVGNDYIIGFNPDLYAEWIK